MSRRRGPGEQSLSLAGRYADVMIAVEPEPELTEGFAEVAIPCGPDVSAHVDAVQTFVAAGFTDVAVVQIGGGTQPAFLDWAEPELLPALRS